MSEFPPVIAPLGDGSGVTHEATEDTPEPVPITEQEVGEYREQDRYLPVRHNNTRMLRLKASMYTTTWRLRMSRE